MLSGRSAAGRYRLLRKTAEGGMGAVYEAVDTTSEKTVALKTWRTTATPSRRLRSRFQKEVQALALVEHPAIVRYLDHGESEELGPFVVMEWVPGQTLAERLETTGITPRGAFELARRLARGLAALHALGVVHRDVKPSNVLLPGGDPATAILVDLGVARLSDAADATKTAGPIGTPRYMAPEQIRNSRSVDGKADVFSLGCVLFECLTGRVAFEGSDPVSVLSRILFEPLPVATAIRRDLPTALDAFLLRLMSRDASARPAAAELDGEFAEFTARVGFLPLEAVPSHPQSGSTDTDLLEDTAVDSERRAQPTPPSMRVVTPPSMRVATPSARARAELGMPAFDGAFVGRDDVESELAGHLAAGARVITVWGPAGVGKSRLVRHAIERAIERATERGHPPWDVVAYADLESAGDVDDVVRIVAREAGVRLDSSEAPEVALAGALSRLGRVLVVLDPVEHVAPALSAALRVFGRVAKDVQVLATSRTRFAPPGAVAVELAPLSTRARLGGRSPAADLVLSRARAFLPDISAGDAGETDAIAEELAILLDGLPLAIELLAPRVAVLGLRGLLDELGARRSGREGSGTLTVMREALDRSWVLLPEDEQRTLAACAVFRGGFTKDAAAAVLGEAPPERTFDRLIRLRDRSLIGSRDGGDGSVRLFLLGAVHEYAEAKLGALPEGKTWLERHAAHYGSALYSPVPRVDAAHVARVEKEAENLLAAAERGIEGDDVAAEAAIVALIALEPAVVARGALGTFHTLLDRAVGKTEQADGAVALPLACRVRQIRARLDATSGQLLRAREDLERCLARTEGAGDAALRGSVYLDLGVTHHFGQELSAARACYEKALVLLREAGDLGAEGRCVGNLGALHHDQGALSLAARSYTHAIALLEQSGEVPRRANFIGNLAVLEQELGRLSDARLLYERALTLLESLRNARLLGITLGNFALLELEAANPEAALDLAERSVRLLSDGGDSRSEALACARHGVALSVLGRLGDAEVALARAERLLPQSDALAGEMVSLARAFVDVAWAKEAQERSHGTGSEELALARGRIEHSQTAPPGERSPRERSDDVRALLRIIAPLIDERTARAQQIQADRNP